MCPFPDRYKYTTYSISRNKCAWNTSRGICRLFCLSEISISLDVEANVSSM